MTTDLFGKPIGGDAQPAFKLNLHQKRQATLLYHWMSLHYLRGLKDLIDALIKGADVHLELAKQQGRDALIANDRWGVRDTSVNWSTHVFPALEDLRKSTIKLIAWRTSEAYCGTGANQCARTIQEFSSMWMTPEEEEQFTLQWEAVYKYASRIDDAAGVGGRRPMQDIGMMDEWADHAHLFPRLPKFRVRTDVQGVSGKRPPRTGAYVAQDDPYATLQFAWTGNNDGVLGEAQTFNELGLLMVAEVGRDALRLDDRKLAPFAIREMERNQGLDTGMVTLSNLRNDPSGAGYAMSTVVFTQRPCKWYFVERIEGEFEDEDESVNPGEAPTGTQPIRLRIEAHQPCPKTGYWFTPTRENSRARFETGQTMPDVGGSWGTTIWQWDEQQ